MQRLTIHGALEPHYAGPALRDLWTHQIRGGPATSILKAVHGLMPKRGTADTEAKGGIDARLFERTVRRMLSTPPKPHKTPAAKGAAPKRDPRSSGKGSKG